MNIKRYGVIFLALCMALIFLYGYAQGSGPVSQFQQFQAIPTIGGVDWEYFTIGGIHYLAVAHHFNDTTYNNDSKIYQWNGAAFVEIQTIATNAATDWEFFTIGSDHYLVVANQYNDVSRNIDSIIYQWNGSSFVPYQAIATNGVRDWKYFMIGVDHYLAVANGQNNTSFNVNSRIYRWNGSAFVEIQAIASNWASDWEYFMIGTEHYLALANGRNNTTYNVSSRIYRWNGSSFVEIQAIASNGAVDWEHYMIGSDHYLALANSRNDASVNIDSRLYRWDGSSFVPVQTIGTNGARDWEYFTVDGEHYLAIANNGNGVTSNVASRLYRWDGSSFGEIQAIPTSGGYDWEYFEIDGNHYLGMANQSNDITRNIDSIIYIGITPEIDVLDSGVSIPDDTGLVTFGTTLVGAPITKTFTVENLGTMDLTLTPPITLPVGFSLVNSFGTTTITPTGTTTFEIRLDATSAGVFSGMLAFDNDDRNENPYNFVISGTVLTPTPGYGSVPGVGSTINVGTTTISNTISTIMTVQETGTAQLDVGIPGGGLLTGANAGDFAIVNGPPFSIADGGANQVVTIQCTPSAAGLRTATLSFTTNDPLQPTVSYTLNCTGNVVVPAPTPPPTNNNNNGGNDDDDDDDSTSSGPSPSEQQVFDCWPWLVIVPPQAIPGAGTQCLPSLGEPLPLPSTFRYLGHSTEVTVNDAAGSPVTQFNPPLKICFRYTQTEMDVVGGNPVDFLIQTYHNGIWESLLTLPENDASPMVLGRVCALVDHLTLFAMFENSEEKPNLLSEVEFLPETGVEPASPWFRVMGGLIVAVVVLTVAFGVLKWRRR